MTGISSQTFTKSGNLGFGGAKEAAASGLISGTDSNGLSMKIVKLYQNDPSRQRKRLVPTEFERHDGWIHSIATEKRNIIE